MAQVRRLEARAEDLRAQSDFDGPLLKNLRSSGSGSRMVPSLKSPGTGPSRVGIILPVTASRRKVADRSWTVD